MAPLTKLRNRSVGEFPEERNPSPNIHKGSCSRSENMNPPQMPPQRAECPTRETEIVIILRTHTFAASGTAQTK